MRPVHVWMVYPIFLSGSQDCPIEAGSAVQLLQHLNARSRSVLCARCATTTTPEKGGKGKALCMCKCNGSLDRVTNGSILTTHPRTQTPHVTPARCQVK